MHTSIFLRLNKVGNLCWTGPRSLIDAFVVLAQQQTDRQTLIFRSILRQLHCMLAMYAGEQALEAKQSSWLDSLLSDPNEALWAMGTNMRLDFARSLYQ